MTIDVSANGCEGGGRNATERKEFFFWVDIDFDVMMVGGVEWYVFVPAKIDIAIIPGSFKVVTLQLINLMLDLTDLASDFILLFQQLLN